ncbi:MAG: hypothetical protein GF317_19695 [Candidatus Lokiarchaeota archaeon]|nr:hypothetical protein [Candidatus Lokiarchaeota archaeon]MBD3201721.1 hypothetical protein [Candidatus Lokiarchaeota archaeon]
MELGKLRVYTYLSTFSGLIAVIFLILVYPMILATAIVDVTVYVYLVILLIILIFIITPIYLFWDKYRNQTEQR